MYGISRFKPAQQDFLVNLSLRNQNRNLATSIALARVLSAMVPVPTSPVVSIDLFFTQQVYGHMNTILDDINSIVPIDYKLIGDLTKSFFRHAYDTVHGGVEYAEGCMDTPGLSSFFKISKHFAQPVLDEIQTRAGLIESLVRQFSIVVDAFAKTTQGVPDVAQ